MNDATKAEADAALSAAKSEARPGGFILRRDGAETRPALGEIGLNQFAPYLMNRVVARWNSNLAEALKVQGMTTPRMRALAVLCVSSGLTINELSVFAVTEPSTMSRTLDALEEQGLVRRQQRSEDMRVREIHITETGRAAFEQIWPMMYGMFVAMFDGLDEREYQAFTGTLHKVLRNIRKHDI